MPAAAKIKYDFHTIPVSISVVPPAVRMVVVEAWAERPLGGGSPDTFWTVLPVVAVEVELADVFARAHRPGDYRRPASAGDAGLAGWVHEGPSLCRHPLIVDSEYGIARADEVYAGTSNVAYRVVACTWPEAEDDKRLGQTRKEVEREAVEKLSRLEGARKRGRRGPVSRRTASDKPEADPRRN